MSYDRVGGGGGGGNGGFPPRGQSAQQPTSPQGRTQNPFNDSQQYLAYDHHMPAHQGYTGEERFNSPSPVLPPFRNNSHGRSPSPHNAQSYQLEENPYHADEHSPLQIPMGPGPRMGTPGDRLEMQPTYSVTNVHNSFGHNEAYDASHPYEQQASHEQPYHQQHMPAAGDYSFNPQDHHDGYYDRPYQPTPASEYPPGGEYHNDGYEDDMGTRPILQNGAYGPDPHSAPNGEPDPNYGGGYMDANGEKRTTPPPAPIKRWKTVKEVKLFNGNLVLDCPVPPRLLNQITHAPPPGRDEFTHMRYSAATCDPKDFFNNRFTLRQRLFAKPRHTELFICVTMYNEDEELFARTMVGVMKNIEHMNSRTSSKTWGKDAWKKIVVCIVSDGRAKINPRTRAVLAAMGVYQEGIAKQEVNKQPVTAHVYEYTTQMALDIKQGVVQVRKGNTPVQMLFCLKEKNQKKINSHRWFFQAFGNVLEPNICVLIDAGTRPGRDSIYKLWKAFDLEPMCAGACGEIKAMLNKGKTLINPLVAAQNFEYKTSNILDKPLESVFGFITVLPGAFSAYRYVALQNDKTGAGPLEKYFKGELMHGADAGIFTANMYLAEDRILCFELIAKRNCHWILQYVKSATGETDVPTEMSDFILQRRRWLNGSFFAAVYALTHFYQVFGSAHSFLRKFMFLIEFLYQTVNMIFAWFAIGNFFLVFRILTTSLGSDDLLGRGGQIVAVIMEWFYLVTLVSCFVLSLGNRPQGSSKFYMTMVYFWACLMIYLMFAAVYITVHSIQEQIRTETHFSVGLLFSNNLFFTLIVSMASTYLLWFLMALLFFDPWHMFTSFLQYLLLTPTYVNILNVYAFCNTHDVTWGTKGDTKPPPLPSAAVKPTGGVDVDLPNNDVDLNSQYEAELLSFARKAAPEKKILTREDKQEDYYKGFRSAVVLVWIFCNLALAAIVLNTSGFDRLDVTSGSQEVTEQQRATIYMQVVLWSVAALSAFRFVGSTWFLITRLIRGV